jgi:hypothetical protein
MSSAISSSLAVIWRLQGVRGTIMTCCVDRLSNETFELRILHNGELQMRERHASAHDAAERADALARTLTLNGWSLVEDNA